MPFVSPCVIATRIFLLLIFCFLFFISLYLFVYFSFIECRQASSDRMRLHFCSPGAYTKASAVMILPCTVSIRDRATKGPPIASLRICQRPRTVSACCLCSIFLSVSVGVIVTDSLSVCIYIFLSSPGMLHFITLSRLFIQSLVSSDVPFQEYTQMLRMRFASSLLNQRNCRAVFS